MKDMVLDSNKVALLKEYAKVTERTEDLICMTMTDNPVQFEELTGINIPTVARLGSDGIVCTEIKYRRCTLLLPLKYIAECNVIIDGLLHESLTTRFTAEEDFLGFFTEEVKDETEEKEMTVKELFSKSADEIIDYIEDHNFTVWDSIKSHIFDDMDKDDVPGNVEQDIVDEYIENNYDEVFDKILDNCSSSDLYDYAHKIIDRL